MDKDVMKAIKDHVNDRADYLLGVYQRASEAHTYAAPALAEMFTALADSLRTEADLWTQSKRKGWQSTATALRTTAGTVTEVAKDMEKLAAEPVKRIPIELSHATNGDGFVYRPDGTDPSAADRLAALPDFADAAVMSGAPAAGDSVSGAVGTGDTLAYLRGDTDVIPGAEHGEPKTIIHLDNAGAVFVPDIHPDIHAEAHAMTQTFPMNLPDDVDPFTDPKPPTWGGAGNGAGRYIPSGGRAFSFAELLTPPNPANVPDHWSWSQLQTSEGCGLQYRFSRVESLARIPQWSNIGGDAFHKAAELFDRQHHNGIRSYDVDDVSAVWDQIFMDTIAEVASTSPVPIGKWRVANGGKENQDWWRVEGERMLRTFVEQRAKLAAAANPRKLALLPHAHPEAGAGRSVAVEWPFTITVDGPLGSLTFTNIIDRVWECVDGTLLIEDLKSGSRMPKDTGQLGAYAWGVVASGAAVHPENIHLQPRIMGTFYDARKGIWTPAVDLLAAHPWEEFVYRLHSAEAKRRAGLYTPHVTDLCVACPVQYACPMRNRSTGEEVRP